MLSRRNVTLLGSVALFAAASLALLLLPGWEPALFPAYALVFLWCDFRREEESHVIFMFLAVVAAALVGARSGLAETQAALGAEAAGVCLWSLGLGAHRSRLGRERYRMLQAAEGLDARLRDGRRELGFYETYERSAVSQILLRRDLTSAAKNLSSTMDPREAQLRLLRILEGRYKDSRVSVAAGPGQDPVLAWAAETRAPVLVKDARQDERFGRGAGLGFRSALVVPLNVSRASAGFVRLESDRPQAYGDEDLRTVDLFATLASLTLENIQLYGEVHNLALTDSLTQLYTQRAFRQRLKDELLRAGRSQSPLSLILCDVDHFKRYNDSYGHQAGDELLRQVARILGNFTRPVDCVARYGGEEFALILPGTVRERAAATAELVRRAVEAEPFMFQGQRTRVTMSFGVSAFPADATTQSQLIRTADERLYASKNGGRNRVTS